MNEDQRRKQLHEDAQHYKYIAHEIRSFVNRSKVHPLTRTSLRRHLKHIGELIGAELIRTATKTSMKVTKPEDH